MAYIMQAKYLNVASLGSVCGAGYLSKLARGFPVKLNQVVRVPAEASGQRATDEAG